MKYLQTQFKSIGDYRDEYTLRPIKNRTTVSSGTIKKFGTKSPAEYAGEKKPSKFKGIIGKLSRGLMLPIAMLPIAGLFLGIGSALVTNAGSHEWLRILGNILKVPGDAIFGNLAVLFCIAIAITFANDKGVAGLAAFVGWIAFCGLQSALIINNTHIDPDSGKTVLDSINFLFYRFVPDEKSLLSFNVFNAVFTTNIGIQSLQTSVFGGITIGALTAVLYNKFKNIQMPQVLGFFSGVRFIPIITFVSSILVSLIFCLIWPVFGLGLYKFGQFAGSVPFGLNSFIFGFTERALVPTGLHHAFYMPLWQTSAGGQMILTNDMMINGSYVLVNQQHVTWQAFANTTLTNVVGDQNCWAFINGLVGRDVYLESGVHVRLTFANIAANFKGVNPGQYMQGKYPFMLLALPAAAMGIVMAAPKGNGRKVAFSTVLGSAITCFLTGITEPLEFTFLFLAPALFFGFHALGCAISFWLMNLLGAHCGLSFSGGLIDFCIYGILPDAANHAGANCWIALLIGAPLAVVYFFGFWFFIKKFDIKTPGREGAENKLYTKADYKAKKGEVVASAANADEGNSLNLKGDEKLAYDVIQAYGGKANITNIDACITKLRVEVVLADKVDHKALKDLGAKGVMKISDTAVYAVFGTKADVIKNIANDLMTKI